MSKKPKTTKAEAEKAIKNRRIAVLMNAQRLRRDPRHFLESCSVLRRADHPDDFLRTHLRLHSPQLRIGLQQTCGRLTPTRHGAWHLLERE